jgi:acyl carrier protein phosphodiesterase
MNHIAHFLLAPQTAHGVVGTLLADFHRGPISTALPPEVAGAVALHRAIDSHTDQHRATRHARALFATGPRRYAGVALDLYFDHCLAREWGQYASVPFAAFVGATYERLESGLAATYVPDRMRRMARAMRNEDWLVAYRNFEGVERALGRLNHAIRHRFGREVNLSPLADELRRWQPEIDFAFGELFPDIARLAQTRSASRRADSRRIAEVLR